MKFSIKNMKFSIKTIKFSVYESCTYSSFFLFLTEFSNHMYRKNAVFNGKQKHMKPLLEEKVRKNSLFKFLLSILDGEKIWCLFTWIFPVFVY